MFPNLNLVWTFMLYTMVCRVPHWSYWRYNWWTTNYDLHCSTNFSSDSFSCWVDNCDSDCGGCYCSLLPPQKEEEGIQSVSFVLYIIMMTVMIVLLLLLTLIPYLSSQSSPSSQSPAWNGTPNGQSQCTWVCYNWPHKVYNVMFSAII